MSVSMRTTVRLDDDLLRRAKIRAAEEGTTLTALIERGLHAVLDEAGEARGVREEGVPFKGVAKNPLETMTPYELPPPPTSDAGLLEYVTDPLELARAIEYDADRASYIRSGGKWPD